MVKILVMPYLRNIDAEYEKLSEMVRAAFSALKRGGDWIEEVVSSDDPIATATSGQMTTVSSSIHVMINLILALHHIPIVILYDVTLINLEGA